MAASKIALASPTVQPHHAASFRTCAGILILKDTRNENMFLCCARHHHGMGLHRAAFARNVTEAELIQAATSLARQYDENYAAKDPAAMAALYAADGVLVSPRGPVIRGRAELKAYYTKRFASGAKGHAIKVMEVHVQGEGGYGLSQFR